MFTGIAVNVKYAYNTCKAGYLELHLYVSNIYMREALYVH